MRPCPTPLAKIPHIVITFPEHLSFHYGGGTDSIRIHDNESPLPASASVFFKRAPLRRSPGLVCPCRILSASCGPLQEKQRTRQPTGMRIDHPILLTDRGPRSRRRRVVDGFDHRLAACQTHLELDARRHAAVHLKTQRRAHSHVRTVRQKHERYCLIWRKYRTYQCSNACRFNNAATKIA